MPIRNKSKDNPYTLGFYEEKNIYTFEFKDKKNSYITSIRIFQAKQFMKSIEY